MKLWKLATVLDPDVEEIVIVTGLATAVLDHQGFGVVAAVEVVTIKKTSKMKARLKIWELVLVDEDLAAVHACPTDPEEKDLELEVAVEVVEAIDVAHVHLSVPITTGKKEPSTRP